MIMTVEKRSNRAKEKLSQCHFVYHKSPADGSGMKFGLRRFEIARWGARYETVLRGTANGTATVCSVK